MEAFGLFYVFHLPCKHIPCCRIQGGDKQLEDLFAKESAEAGLLQLFGHPLLGGLRVCIYNGLPDEAISELLVFMTAFMERHRR